MSPKFKVNICKSCNIMAWLAVFTLGSSEDPRSCFGRTCLFWGGNCALLRFHLFCLLQYLASPPSWVHNWEEIPQLGGNIGHKWTFLHPYFATHLSYVTLLCSKKIWNFLASLFSDPALFVPFFLLGLLPPLWSPDETLCLHFKLRQGHFLTLFKGQKIFEF